MADERILAIDIGAGTMDVLLHDPSQPMENAIQLVLPSATSLVGRRIERARRCLTPGSMLADHIWPKPPEYMTRLLAIQADAPGAIVADTGPVAVLGALEDEQVAEAAERGACIVNVGNQHTLALLVRGEEL